jgi:uncharacterized protein YmfQ (DUF2313 family)
MSYNAFSVDCRIKGSHLDDAYYSAQALLREVYPDQSVQLLRSWERVYSISYPGGIPPYTNVRQANIITAMRARGGLNKPYLISLGVSMNYTVSILENISFSFFLGDTHPPATQLPSKLFDPNLQYSFTYVITNPTPVPELEKLISNLKPAWTTVKFQYI